MASYYERNKDKWNVYYESRKKILNTSDGKKSQTISCWKRRGLKGNYDEIYDIYINTNICNICGKKDISGKDKHMEHCHNTGKFRGVVCERCNNNMKDRKVQSNNKLKIKNVYYDEKIKSYIFDKKRNGIRYQLQNKNKSLILWYKFTISLLI